MFHMKFVFDTSPQPCVRRLKQTKDGIQLQCEVRGASPKPELHWEDGAGNVLLAEKPQESERGGIYNVILQTIVTKTDIYCCVATQEAINQTTHDDINVYIPGLTAGQIALIVIIVVGVVGLVFAVYIRRYRIISFFMRVEAKPSVRIVEQRDKSALLQCEVRGAFPKPKLHWEDREGHKLPAEEPQESERGGHYDIILITTVTKTDIYRCVATQKEINHQAHADIHVHISGLTAGQIALIVIIVVGVVGLVFAVYIRRYHIISLFIKVEAKPSVRIVEQTDKSALLQCEVRGAFPKPELHWEDGDGNILPAEEPQESERGGHYDIILITTVTKTDRYRCVATQKEINHQAHADIHVHISGTTDPTPPSNGTAQDRNEGSEQHCVE
ncbi:uncharacterized protein LOC133978030 [Scomber scombrus]|uniref:uncharacterized protein LOC133978030 n=1 Tax=Scomber scombrus TaxID=13677 RepID=UPI002DD87236|nr:uncharacterized protein LOC133978030 [Scomber scombrus]